MLKMSWKESFKQYAKKQPLEEACGLLAIIKGKETFWPCKNLAEGKFEFFILDPDDWAECEDQGEILGVIHSHPTGPATPSDNDKAACEHLGFPYYIYSMEHDHWECIEPSGWKAPSLIGRKFIWGKYDCWSIVTDWYEQNLQIKIPYLKRTKKIKDFSDNPYFEKALKDRNFIKQNTNNNFKVGDILLFQSITGNLDHVALYIGDMMILNHNLRSLSCREPFNLAYQRQLRGVYRYAA